LVKVGVFQRGVVHFERKFQVEDVAPNHCWYQKTRVFMLPHSEDRMFLCSFVWAQYQRVTDRWTERRAKLPWLIQRSALQAMRPRCKNCFNSCHLRSLVNIIIYFYTTLFCHKLSLMYANNNLLLDLVKAFERYKQNTRSPHFWPIQDAVYFTQHACIQCKVM